MSGCLLYLVLPLYAYQKLSQQESRASAADAAVFAVFFYGVALCFLLSAGLVYGVCALAAN